MANAEQAAAHETSQSLIDQLGMALLELHAHNHTSEDRVEWTEVEEHFHNLEMTLKKQSEELEAKEKKFEEQEAETFTLLVEREATVIAKEQDLLDRVQELKDAAVAAIAEAWDIHEAKVLELMNNGNNKDSKVSRSLGDTNSAQEDIPTRKSDNAKGMASDIKPRPELRQFCEQMDGKGLLNYIVENLKKQNVARQELTIALESASEPVQLVLDSLEGFYPLDVTNQPEGKKDPVLRGKCRSCLMLMEALTTLVAKADPGADRLLNPGIKQQAKAIANEWKPKLFSGGNDAANGLSLEAEAFLQLLATFRIASEFDDEELCKIILAAVAHRRQTPELCRTLGLTHKMPGLVESMIRIGKQIDAVHFIHAFELSESFPPVPLLKTYLKELRRNSQGDGNGDAQEDVNAKELSGLKAVVGCVQEYKLEAEYPLDPLQKRLAQLERSRADRKRNGDTGKRQQAPKKQKATGRWHGYRGGPGLAIASPSTVARLGQISYADRPVYSGLSERYGLAGPRTYDYQIPTPPAYTPQASEQRLYYYPTDDRVVPTTSYNAAPVTYGSYIGTGLQSPHQAYM
ncbi:FRIGIDA-like protein 3 [Argentina anserina]|uniref:FRIGIDA-like protein 3 n=1 Tax=Argentina anserina TaxID=57926 RepID=UPI002176672A|nr:FRIGIDA-like protein 3 [Potentilla anserina]